MEGKLELIECKKCSNQMPKLRKELYGYDFCVKCSTVMPKVGRVVTYGQGEDIWNDLEIMDQESAKRILELEQMNSSNNFEILELLDYNQDSAEDSEPKYKNIGAVNSVISNFDYIDIESSDELDQDDEEDIVTEEDSDDIIGITNS
jgi:hypothetical protein